MPGDQGRLGSCRQLGDVESAILVLADWQVVEVEQLPTESVGQFMTADPVTVVADTPLAELVQKMIDAHLHRLIVVDHQGRPIGVVSSTDILACVARGAAPEEGEEIV